MEYRIRDANVNKVNQHLLDGIDKEKRKLRE